MPAKLRQHPVAKCVHVRVQVPANLSTGGEDKKEACGQERGA